MMTSTPRGGKHAPESENASPVAAGGHKASFRSTKLARRARSFKDDFLEKISQMRSPTAQGGRVASPKPRPKAGLVDTPPAKGPVHELAVLGRQVELALKHLKDVVSKNTLEMLPGNGTIVLDTVWAINLAVKSSVPSDFSSSICSATLHMYQSVARLIKLCDDALIHGDQSAALSVENVEEVVEQVEESVQSLIKLAQEKITQQRTLAYKATPRASFGSATLDLSTQRNSLPDIPLTPKERQILEQNASQGKVRSSHSTESVLRDENPPPKPPLPDGYALVSLALPPKTDSPPPLPPKKRNNLGYHPMHEFNSDNSLFERMSMRSQSPDDSSSLLSASADSLDSLLNRSRDDDDDDDEIGELMELRDNDESEEPPDYWDDAVLHDGGHGSASLNNELQVAAHADTNNRLSNADSGFVSVHSHRNSSYSKRSSQQSTNSAQWAAAQQQTYTAKHTTNMIAETSRTETMMQRVNLNSLRSDSFREDVSNSTISSVASSSCVEGRDPDGSVFVEDTPPAIPEKSKRRGGDRQVSPYDNVASDTLDGELLVACQMHQSQSISSSGTSMASFARTDNRPPPLPPKKKHMFQSVAYSVMAYMEVFGNCSHANDQEFMRHSVHMVQGQCHAPLSPPLPTTQSCTFSHASQSSSRFTTHSQMQVLSIQPTSSGESSLTPSPLKSPASMATPPHRTTPPALPPKRARTKSNISEPPLSPLINERHAATPVKSLPDLLEHTNVATTVSPKPLKKKNEAAPGSDCAPAPPPCDIDLMEALDVHAHLVLKKADEEGPEIRGGYLDALIIMATKATKNGEEKESAFTYQEAFLTTYRTFISPYELISKLIRRYDHFYCIAERKPRSREAFALTVRVVNDLTPSDLDCSMQQMLMDFVQQLITCGELTLAKALRVKHLEKHDQAKRGPQSNNNYQSSLTLSSRNYTLLDFKSEQIAEQMTLLDAELFMKIEIPEVLIWAQEQNEERSPNLTRFTEHFNKMSYWARTRILSADAKDREKYFMKFIKIMKHLRKINNFNSYLALLSALDSAPVRRLEWQKHVQEGLKEYCALIDSSSSFRAYRQALSETQPPCIPYIGLVLQDLTFVHIGNSNLLADGTINFSKRWQQFNIVENMKRFKKCTYSFKRNDRIINFFQNFDDFIGEDAMWQLSESIKPRGGKRNTQ